MNNPDMLCLNILRGKTAEAMAFIDSPAFSDLKKDTAFVFSAAAAAIVMDMPELIPPLLAGGADVNYSPSKSGTLLHIAARTDNLRIVRLLLDAGADALSQDGEGMLPWELAKHPETITLLYESGESQSARSEHEHELQLRSAHNRNLERLNRLARPRRPAP